MACPSSLEVSGAGDTDADGTYTQNGTSGGREFYEMGDYWIEYNDSEVRWELWGPFFGGDPILLYSGSVSGDDCPHDVEWTTDGGTSPAPTVSDGSAAECSDRVEVSGAGSSDANGIYLQNGTDQSGGSGNERAYYENDSSPWDIIWFDDGVDPEWYIRDGSGNIGYRGDADPDSCPYSEEVIYTTSLGDSPAPTVTSVDELDLDVFVTEGLSVGESLSLSQDAAETVTYGLSVDASTSSNIVAEESLTELLVVEDSIFGGNLEALITEGLSLGREDFLNVGEFGAEVTVEDSVTTGLSPGSTFIGGLLHDLTVTTDLEPGLSVEAASTVEAEVTESVLGAGVEASTRDAGTEFTAELGLTSDVTAEVTSEGSTSDGFTTGDTVTNTLDAATDVTEDLTFSDAVTLTPFFSLTASFGLEGGASATATATAEPTLTTDLDLADSLSSEVTANTKLTPGLSLGDTATATTVHDLQLTSDLGLTYETLSFRLTFVVLAVQVFVPGAEEIEIQV